MTKDEFRTWIHASDLPDDDKKLWEEILESVNDEQIAVFEEVLKGDPQWLVSLTENIKMKRAAFAADDRTKLDAIVAQERRELENL